MIPVLLTAGRMFGRARFSGRPTARRQNRERDRLEGVRFEVFCGTNRTVFTNFYRNLDANIFVVTLDFNKSILHSLLDAILTSQYYRQVRLEFSIPII